jgi:DNA primase
MGKVSQNSANYEIKAELSSNGVIEKSDVVGAIFGQTEGLLGEDLDLRELRNRGKVGRIEVDLDNSGGSTEATVEISTSLDAADTSILAASLETIEKVGPTQADFRIKEVVDVRSSKRDYILKRSKQILQDIKRDTPDMNELKHEVKAEVREGELIEYEGFQAGPDVRFSEEIILVEGVADVKNLQTHGVKNGLALGGTSVPEDLSRAVEDREVTAFLDGDRGGDLILEELKDNSEPEFVARAPEDKEVEELGEREIFEALRDKEAVKYVETEEVDDSVDDEELEEFGNLMKDLVATRALNVVDEDFEVTGKAPMDNTSALDTEDGYAVLADGEIGEKEVSLAERIGANFVIGRNRSGTANSSQVRILTDDELKG